MMIPKHGKDSCGLSENKDGNSWKSNGWFCV